MTSLTSPYPHHRNRYLGHLRQNPHCNPSSTNDLPFHLLHHICLDVSIHVNLRQIHLNMHHYALLEAPSVPIESKPPLQTYLSHSLNVWPTSSNLDLTMRHFTPQKPTTLQFDLKFLFEPYSQLTFSSVSSSYLLRCLRACPSSSNSTSSCATPHHKKRSHLPGRQQKRRSKKGTINNGSCSDGLSAPMYQNDKLRDTR